MRIRKWLCLALARITILLTFTGCSSENNEGIGTLIRARCKNDSNQKGVSHDDEALIKKVDILYRKKQNFMAYKNF